MVRRIMSLLLAVLFAFSLATPAFAQDTPKKEAKGMSMKESGTLKEVTCDPACGFRVQSKSSAEIISMVKEHAKKFHSMKLTDAQVKEKIQEVK